MRCIFLSLLYTLIGHPLPAYPDTELHRPNNGDIQDSAVFLVAAPRTALFYRDQCGLNHIYFRRAIISQYMMVDHTYSRSRPF
jgi:hypothetical protein